ncbi:MAG: hypothetical protein ACJ748_13140 [Flavisolibacter sp.]
MAHATIWDKSVNSSKAKVIVTFSRLNTLLFNNLSKQKDENKS